MKTTDYQKAIKIFAGTENLKTAIRQSQNSEVESIVKKMFNRKKVEIPTVKQFTDSLIVKKLNGIAICLPSEGYSMGSIINVYFNRLKGSDNRCQEYSNSCSFNATHGCVNLKLTCQELKHIKCIGGIVTYIYPHQRNLVKKCYWYEGKGKRHNFKLVKVEGYIYAGYHSYTKEQAKIGGEYIILTAKTESKKVVSFEKALRLQYTFNDSLKAGNCEVGTKAFQLRLGLSDVKKYRGSYILKLAKEKSTSSVYYVERMIKARIKTRII